MGKAKAKIASKNNPEGRGQAKEYFHNGKKIKPVKLIAGRQSFFAAEYEDSGDLVVDQNGKALPWASAKILG
jgi:antitoxin component YwqK of YwqJK toxin-antitoxin module